MTDTEIDVLREAYDKLYDVLYRTHGTGGALHIVTDDGNEEDSSIAFVLCELEQNRLDDPEWLLHVQRAMLELIKSAPENSDERFYICNGYLP